MRRHFAKTINDDGQPVVFHDGPPENEVAGSRGKLVWDTAAGECWIKTTDGGLTGWTELCPQVDGPGGPV